MSYESRGISEARFSFIKRTLAPHPFNPDRKKKIKGGIFQFFEERLYKHSSLLFWVHQKKNVHTFFLTGLEVRKGVFLAVFARKVSFGGVLLHPMTWPQEGLILMQELSSPKTQ